MGRAAQLEARGCQPRVFPFVALRTVFARHLSLVFSTRQVLPPIPVRLYSDSLVSPEFGDIFVSTGICMTPGLSAPILRNFNGEAKGAPSVLSLPMDTESSIRSPHAATYSRLFLPCEVCPFNECRLPLTPIRSRGVIPDGNPVREDWRACVPIGHRFSEYVDPAGQVASVYAMKAMDWPTLGSGENFGEFQRACRRRISGDTPSYIHRGSRGSVICSEYAERLCRYRIEW